MHVLRCCYQEQPLIGAGHPTLPGPSGSSRAYPGLQGPSSVLHGEQRLNLTPVPSYPATPLGKANNPCLALEGSMISQEVKTRDSHPQAAEGPVKGASAEEGRSEEVAARGPLNGAEADVITHRERS